MESPKNPWFEAIREVSRDPMIRPYKEFMAPSLSGIVLRYLEDDRTRFDDKRAWLTGRFALVFANPNADAVGQLQRQVPGALEQILVYEDGRVQGAWKGAWRVHCDQDNGESTFLWRYWTRGRPDVLGEDTMMGALGGFHERYKPKVINHFGRNYTIEIDFERLVAASSVPVKKF